MEWNQLLNPNRVRQTTGGSSSDARLEFERDYDRSIFSTPVKRLQDKAQVHPLDPNDAVRTRLTHSLEVSCVARGLATSVGKKLQNIGKLTVEQAHSIATIASTCGLLHDLGNPPFGHAGEIAIQDWFKEVFPKERPEMGLKESYFEDFAKFDGNPQTLRLVSKLQVMADRNGLNLTFGTLSALCKYIPDSQNADNENSNCANKKTGYFTSEKEKIEQIRTETGTGNVRNPITFLVEAADDIVYSVADIEDGIKKGLLSWREVLEVIDNFEQSKTEMLLSRINKILLISKNEERSKYSDVTCAAAFRTAAIGILSGSAIEAFETNYDQIMSGTMTRSLAAVCSESEMIKAFKMVGLNKIYCCKDTIKMEIMGKKVIKDLLSLFWDGVKEYPITGAPITREFSGKIASLLSDNYCHCFQQARAEESGVPEIYHRLQLLFDYICGMTDTFATTLHSELMHGGN